MLEFHLHIENIDRELREIAIQRPRIDRPDPQQQSWLRTLLRGFALPLARAVCEPGARIPNVTIRSAQAADLRELTRLAELSERRVPAGLVLVAEVETDIVAALPVGGGRCSATSGGRRAMSPSFSSCVPDRPAGERTGAGRVIRALDA